MIDWTKPLQMMDGTPVMFQFRINNPHFPMVCIWTMPVSGIECIDTFTEDGRAFQDGRDSIMNLKNVEEGEKNE